jgi:transposase
MRGEVLEGVERRRRWSAEQKLEIALAAMEPGVSVSAVARRYAVSRQQVYGWRRAALRGDFAGIGGPVGFVEVAPAEAGGTEARALVETGSSPASIATGAEVTVEIGVAGGRSLRIPAGLSEADLRRLIRAVEGA